MSEHSQEYKEYIVSSSWKQKRWVAIQRANNRCQRCGKSIKEVPLQVHHLTYDRLGCERDEDLLVVCAPCHEKEDEKRRIAVEKRSENRLYDARMDGWAKKVYGPDWQDWANYEEVEERFEQFLERVDDDW